MKKYSNLILPKNSKCAIFSMIVAFILATMITIFYYITCSDMPQKYTDISYGTITALGANKSTDMITYYLFIFAFTLLFILSSYMFNKFSHIKAYKNILTNKSEDLNLLVLFTCVFIVFSIVIIRLNGLDKFVSCFVIGLIVLGFSAYNNTKTKNLCMEITLSFYFVYIFCCGVMSFAVGIMPQYTTQINKLFVPILAIFLITMGYKILSLLSKDNQQLIDLDLGAVILKTQMLVPIALLSITNVQYFYDGQKVDAFGLTKFKIFIYAIIFFMIIYNFIKIRNSDRKKGNLILLSTVIVFTIVVCWNVDYNLVINQDPFHKGETAIIWQQIFQKGQVWGEDFVSVLQGLGMINSGINEMFFSGTFSTYVFADEFMETAAMVLLVVAAYYFYNNKAFIFLLVPIVGVLAPMNRIYLVLPIVLLLLNSKLLKRPILWTYIYIATCFIHIWYQPTYGGVTAVIMLPILLSIWWNEYKNGEFLRPRTKIEKRKVLLFLISVSLCGILAVPMLLEVLRFMSENAAETLITNGIPLKYSVSDIPMAFTNIKLLDYILYFFVKFGIGVVFCIATIYFLFTYALQEENYIKRIQGMTLSAGGLVLFVLSLNAIWVRIDPNGLSRIGMFAILICNVILLSLIYLFYDKFKYKAIAMISITILIISMVYVLYPTQFTLHTRATSQVTVPEDAQMYTEEETNLSNLGNAYVTDPEYILKAQIVKDLCDKVLTPEQTYYDFTDKSIFYLYTDRKVPGLYVSPMIVANEKIQTRVIEQLKKNDVPIIYIDNPLQWCGPNALRTYRIYKYFIEKDYIYINYKGSDFLIRSDVDLSKIQNDIIYDISSTKLLTVLEKYSLNVMDTIDYNNVFATNSVIFRKEEAVVSGVDAFYCLKLNKELNFADIDYIKINLKNISSSNQVGQLFYTTSKYGYDELYSTKFEVSTKGIVLPMSKETNIDRNCILKDIRLDFDGINIGDDVSIDSVEFFSFNKEEKQKIKDAIINDTKNDYYQYSEDKLNITFKPQNYGCTASEWGNNYANMFKRFKNTSAKYNIINENKKVQIIFDEKTTGSDIEFMYLNNNSILDNTITSVKVNGVDRNGNEFTEEFEFLSGKKMLCPLGTSSKCLRADFINSIELDFENSVQIDQILLLKLIK